MKKSLLTIIISLFLMSQNLMGSMRWEVYSSYKTYSQIEEFNNKLYVRSGNSVFSTDFDNESFESLTQVDGLSSSSILFMSKSEAADILSFIHQDGTIDFLDKKGNISSLYDLKNKSIVGDKTINHVTTCGSKLFLACGFGFVEADLNTQLLTNYYLTPESCEFAFYYEGAYYYALTNGGLWRCESGKNLAIDSNWTKTENKKICDVAVFTISNQENCWIVDEAKDIHILNLDGSYRRNSGRKCYETLKFSGNYIFSKGWGFDIIKPETQEISYVQNSPYSACRDYYSLNDSILYALHPNLGIMKLKVDFNNRNHAQISQLSEQSQYSEIAGSQICGLAYNSGVLAGISGYKMYASNYTEMFLSTAAVNYFEDGEWHNISKEDVLKQPLASKEFRGLTGISSDPNNDNRFYISTLTTGIYQFDGDSLTARPIKEGRYSDIFCDEDGILWTVKPVSDTTVYSYDTKLDKLQAHPVTEFSQLSHIERILRQNNQSHRLIWALNNYPYHKSRIGILYNPTDPNENSQDQSAYITSLLDQDGNTYSFENAITTVYDLCEDLDGKIWILTNIGPFVIEDVISTFNHAQKNPGVGLVKRIKIPRNDGTNLADYLLSTTSCTAMAIDQFNRKWIGTLNDGIYLISSDGIEEIEHYTTENAPLHNNYITSLAYDQNEKRLFIGSDGGVVILHTDELEPTEDFDSFHCFPNPVRPDYYGDIQIVGLMPHTQISITDATGNLIWKTICENGSSSWDGCDNAGNRVTPGVYLIHATSSDTSKGEICKLLVL